MTASSQHQLFHVITDMEDNIRELALSFRPEMVNPAAREYVMLAMSDRLPMPDPKWLPLVVNWSDVPPPPVTPMHTFTRLVPKVPMERGISRKTGENKKQKNRHAFIDGVYGKNRRRF